MTVLPRGAILALLLCAGALGGRTAAQQAPRAPRQLDIDHRWAEIAKRVPGFAGWWYVGDTAVVVLVDPAQRDAAVREIQPAFARRHIRNVRVQKADFDFVQLLAWKELASFDTLSHITAVDADEVRNRLVVYVADSTHIAATRSALLAKGIPPAALVLEVGSFVEY